MEEGWQRRSNMGAAGTPAWGSGDMEAEQANADTTVPGNVPETAVRPTY